MYQLLALTTPLTGETPLPSWVVPAAIVSVVVFIGCIVVPIILNKKKNK